jgi:hypothetical protein
MKVSGLIAFAGQADACAPFPSCRVPAAPPVRPGCAPVAAQTAVAGGSAAERTRTAPPAYRG